MLLVVRFAGASVHAGTVRVTLPQAVITSAGVFDLDEHLIRTLWSAQHKERGPLSISWDGRDDEGHVVTPARRYVVKVLMHDVNYRWQGVIGNTSRDQTGVHVFRSFLPIHNMAFSPGGQGFYVVGYNERQAGMHRFQPSEPDSQDALAHDDWRRIFRYVAADADAAYFANVGLPAPHPGDYHDAETFVLALNVADGSERQFAAGRHVGPAPENEWQSVIDYDAEEQDADGQLRLAPTGLAVQRRGDTLFVAHAGAGEIRLFNKHTGAQIGRIVIDGAGEMAVAPDDSLWVLCRTAQGNLVRHLRSRAGSWAPDVTLAPDVVEPVALGVSPIDGTVVLADADTDQLRAFNASGAPAWRLGRPAGYRTGGPDVTVDRFGFEGGPTYVAFQSDGSFWFGDPKNERNLHYSAKRRYLNQIMYLPHTRVVTVDANNPRRVFGGFLEFAVDYAKPLASSWQLVRNWSAGLDARYSGDFEGLQSVVTLPDGSTLGVVRRYDLNRNELVKLTPNGLKPVGATIDFNTRLYPDGSLRLHQIRGDDLKIFTRRLDGSDAGKLRWMAPKLLARVPMLQADDPYYHDVPFIPGINESVYPQTARGVILSFNPGHSRGFHLGGIDPAREGWLWRASPTGSWDVDSTGNVTPKDGRYEVDQGVQYPGNTVLVAGRQVVYGYHGEAWRSGEADQWLHFYDDGLFVGQFGTPGLPRPPSERAAAVAGFAGNAFSGQLVSVNGEAYLWHNDESGHGGVHRWWLQGAAAMQELKAPIQP